MDPVLDILLDLDRLEMDRQASERALSGLPAQVKALQTALATRKKGLSLLLEQIETREQELYAASHQVIARNAEINRLQEFLTPLAPKREYEALHAGILRQQEALAALTRRQVQLRGELDALRIEHVTQQKDWENYESGATGELSRLRVQLAEGEAQVATQTAQISHHLGQLPAEVSKDWRLLAKARADRAQDGLRRGLVSPMSATDGHCKICYAELTRHLLRALNDVDTVLQCPSCGAFLVAKNPSEKRLA